MDVRDYLDLRDAALRAHATQVDPDSGWFAMPNDLIREVYPWEDFTLAASRVPCDEREDSLFAGLDAPVPTA